MLAQGEAQPNPGNEDARPSPTFLSALEGRHKSLGAVWCEQWLSHHYAADTRL